MQFLADRSDLDDIFARAVAHVGHNYRYSDEEGVKSKEIFTRILNNPRVHNDDAQSLRNVRIFGNDEHNQLFWDYVISQVAYEYQSLELHIAQLKFERRRLYEKGQDLTPRELMRVECIGQELPALLRIEEYLQQQQQQKKTRRRRPKNTMPIDLLERELSALEKEVADLEKREAAARLDYDRIPEWEQQRKKYVYKLTQTAEDRRMAQEFDERMTMARVEWDEAWDLLRKAKIKRNNVLKKIREARADDSLKSNICASCQRVADMPVKCGHCEEVTYCGQECANEHWNTHSLE